jgi:hypothetical protein
LTRYEGWVKLNKQGKMATRAHCDQLSLLQAENRRFSQPLPHLPKERFSPVSNLLFFRYLIRFSPAQGYFFLPPSCKSLFDVISSHPERRKCYICLWLGQSLLYTVLLSFVTLNKSEFPLRDSRLALKTGVLRFHGILRVINTLCPYTGLV